MEHVLEISGLKKSFGKREILKGLNLELKRAENIAILGGSGTGKSVFIKSIVGLVIPDSGSIKVLGKKLDNLEYEELNNLRLKVGYLFQGGALYDSMSVKQNLEFPVRRSNISKNKKEIEEMIEQVLESVGLNEAKNKMPAELSGGMKKRIALARTLILKPEIILYDEPTTGLDPVTSGEISELMLKIQEEYNASSITVTHDIKCVKMTADRIKLIRDGIFSAAGTYDELTQSDDKYVREFLN